MEIIYYAKNIINNNSMQYVSEKLQTLKNKQNEAYQKQGNLINQIYSLEHTQLSIRQNFGKNCHHTKKQFKENKKLLLDILCEHNKSLITSVDFPESLYQYLIEKNFSKELIHNSKIVEYTLYYLIACPNCSFEAFVNNQPDINNGINDEFLIIDFSVAKYHQQVNKNNLEKIYETIQPIIQFLNEQNQKNPNRIIYDDFYETIILMEKLDQEVSKISKEIAELENQITTIEETFF